MKKTLVAAALLMLAMGAAQAQHLTGAGATFPYPIYSKWFNEYSSAHPGVEINYQSIGSGGGITQVTKGTVDFGASDMPMTDKALAESPVKLVHIPTVLGAVVPIFNVAGVSDLKLGPDVLAEIYMNKITSWNDPKIAKDNPGVNLPSDRIIVVHRSDGSGTTFIWTDYLSKVNKDWADGPGKGTSVNWPTGIGGKGNENVASLVRQNPGAIGYVELIYALQNKINFGEVKNANGKWLKASIDGVTAAAATAKIPADYRVSITNAPGDTAYPISSFTYLLIPMKSTDPTKAKVLHDMLSWIIKSGEGEVTSLSYAPLPSNLAEKVLQTVYSLQ
ncbi:phosphate ABC transporter substrate-binding protein PstS [Occallatibacter riparius]|uniref:Phosphate-binding protein n=1 Tax=Occallatibacter riparius TaxID=1002689 RepID=A0A9J7BQ87_9BACT|nr:phosphate ABC transporter substrate-binding protein PstS [Occallatibacter riparius]UWZ83269.1 phosphate ABC transporter substrate-binding protein PstS [Occallatibacter riparius]